MEYYTVMLNRSNLKKASLEFETDEQNDRSKTTYPDVLNFELSRVTRSRSKVQQYWCLGVSIKVNYIQNKNERRHSVCQSHYQCLRC